MAPKPSSQSAKKASKRPIGRPRAKKYASKVVGEVLDKLIASKINELDQRKKKTKTIKKWCEKMKLSIQRKVSEASRTLFASNHACRHADTDIKSLEEKILTLKEGIRQREENIAAKAIAMIKANSLHELPSMSEAGSYIPKQFESQTQRISNSFSKLAQHIDKVTRELPIQINKLKSVVQVVDSSWQQKLQEEMANSSDRYDDNDTEDLQYDQANMFPSGRVQSHLNSYE